MGRGRSKAASRAGVTIKQAQTLARIANRTRNYKNEQYRIINEDGEIVLEKKGGQHEVAATVGEKREYMKGAVSIHNHPEGGTFSQYDFNDFGFGARQVVVASPEGNYILTNINYGTKRQYNGWVGLRDALDEAGITNEMSFTEINKKAQNYPNVKKLSTQLSNISGSWAKARESGEPKSKLDKYVEKYNKISQEYKEAIKVARRDAETKPYHDFYKKNASKYGFKYQFVPKK